MSKYFGYCKGFGGVLVLVHSLYAAACGTWPITLQTDLQPTDNDVRNQENRTLMQKCSSCVIVISSFISGTGSKNGVVEWGQT